MALPQPQPSAHRFEGKYALVTGASKGIGMGVAIRLAQEGAHVCIHYGRDLEGAERTASIIAEKLAESGVEECRTLILGADMGKEAEVKSMFERYFEKWERLDVVIPNAGIQLPAESHLSASEDFDRVLDVNLKGYYYCAKAAIAHFLSREGGGSIVFDSSVHQIIPKPTYLGYACSKAAIGHMTSTLALEYAGRGVRVNCVAPGAIATPMNMAWIEDETKREEVCSHIPMGRPGSAEEIAAVFAFLASDDATYITGQTLYACGGLTLYPEFRTAWSSE
eukprot:TRINITY_DN3877_c0_g1_i1.p1 TRINITY_DN3877_c0_g1~~TRINITY_DN3877_c0_g1_i1.p1  ORF type:complete len:279 (-),score=65.38 TRINITY_DN3877_c0_g1_i1:390-1226(-)